MERCCLIGQSQSSKSVTADIGAAMLCLETCSEDSLSYSDAMSMDHLNDQGMFLSAAISFRMPAIAGAIT